MLTGAERSTIVICEWETIALPEVRLTDRDRRALGRIGQRLIIEELRAGIRVSATGFVGTVQLDSITVHVSPKIAGDALDVVRLLAATRGLGSLQRQLGRQRIETAGHRSLVDLLALLFAEATERTLRGGLVSDYLEREDDLKVIRGRLLVDRQLMSQFGQVHRIWCRFDELEQDTDDNRLLCLALHAAARVAGDSDVRRRLRYLGGIFDEVCTFDALRLDALRNRLVYNRQNAHYRDAHGLAWLILDAVGVTDISGIRGESTSFAFLIDMAKVFEDWIGRLAVQCFPQSHFGVAIQDSSLMLRDGSTGAAYARPRPDVIVRCREELTACAIDAKYKALTLKTVPLDDLYQCFTYASLLATSKNAQLQRSFLVYPSAGPRFERNVIQFPRIDGSFTGEVALIGLPVRRCFEQAATESTHPIAEFKEVIGAALHLSNDAQMLPAQVV